MAEFQPYPSWRDHTDGRERLVQNAEEDAALGEGWSARGTIVQQPTEDERAAAAVQSGEFRSYPSWRHHVSGRSCVVDTEEQDAALGDGWYRDADEARLAGQADATSGATHDDADGELAEQRAAFHATPADAIAETLAKASAEHVEDIRALRAWEVAHPKYPGGRKTVLAAIDARIFELTAPAAASTS